MLLRSWDKRDLLTLMASAMVVSDRASGSRRYWSSVMGIGLDCLNETRKRKCLGWRNADFSRFVYNAVMTPRHDWYLKEWLKASGKRQADIVRDLDWNKARVSLMLRGIQPYDREAINELASYLSLRPHELLMHPEDANALRALRKDTIRIAHSSADDDEDAQKKVSSN